MFACFLAQTQQFGTVRNTISGLKAVWASYGVHADFARWTGYARVMKGIRRSNSRAPNQKHAISPTELVQMRQFLPSTHMGTALWACMMVTWWGMLRKSNTTSGFQNPMDPGACILVSDVAVEVGTHTLQIAIRKSKTNQFRDRVHTLHIAGDKGSALDPVAAWMRHVEVNDTPSHLTAFSYRSGSGWEPMLHSTLVSATKTLASKVGLDPESVSGHSYRRGGASFAFKAGVSEMLIQRQGDWRSDAYKGYIVLSEEQQLRASRAMAEFIRQGGPSRLPVSHSFAGHVGLPEDTGEVYPQASSLTDPRVLLGLSPEVVDQIVCPL